MDQPNVGNMNSYYGNYGKTYSADDMQRVADRNNRDAMTDMMVSNGMDPSHMVGGQTLDEIINQNNKEMQRRRSYHQPNAYGSRGVENDSRRSSMMEFGSGNSDDLDGFQFDPPPVQTRNDMQRPNNILQRRIDSQRARHGESADNLALNTNFHNYGPDLNPHPSNSPYQHPSSSPYHRTLNPSESLGIDVTSYNMQNDMLMGMEYPVGSLDQQDTSGNVTPINMFARNNFVPDLTASPIQQTLSNPTQGRVQDPGGGDGQGAVDKVPNMQVSDQMQNLQVNFAQPSVPISSSSPVDQSQGTMDTKLLSKPQQNINLDSSFGPTGMTFTTSDSTQDADGTSSTFAQYRNVYSSTGFDMLGVLMRVATRPNPQINIGAVDMSCAFVVCDVTQHDIPIVYCSDVFERLTGYSRHDILGRNCRFLQAPDGKIQAGIKRKYVDDQAVLRIKNKISQRQETQISLINYRKGGQPFMNLLTMIPITWDTDEIKYFVGFQVDLVEQPTSITNKNPGPSMSPFLKC